MTGNPLDELNSQLPGRLIAVEVLLVLLLRKKADAAKILREADGIVTALEAEEIRYRGGEADEYLLKLFNAARENIEKISQGVRGGRPPRD